MRAGSSSNIKMNNNLKEKIKLLKKVSIFTGLKKAELDIISRFSEYSDYKNGETIFQSGSSGDELFVVKKGEVIISRQTANMEELVIARYVNGESFGELDLLVDTPRSATARASEDTLLLHFPETGVELNEVFNRHPEVSAVMLHKLLAMIAGRIRNANRQISEKTPWMEDLKLQLLHDKLTGIYNNIFLEEDFAEELPGYGGTTGFLMIKPDNFKKINDTYGHEGGDNALKVIVEIIKSELREKDIAARYKGDVFSVILPETETEEIVKFAENLVSSIRSRDIKEITGGNSFFITVSIGASSYPVHADSSKGLIELAYDRMMEARESGGNRVQQAT